MYFKVAVMTAMLGFAGRGVAQAAPYKCIEDGKAVFQQVPCPNTGITVKEHLERQKAEREAAAQRAKEQAELDRQRQERLDARPLSSLSPVERAERELRELDKKSKALEQSMKDGSWDREFQAKLDKYCGGRAMETLRLGITEEQMLNCSVYRTPDSVNTTSTAGGVMKQYVFRIWGSTSKPTFVYFRNGVLTGVQD